MIIRNLEIKEIPEKDESIIHLIGHMNEHTCFPSTEIKLRNKLIFDCEDLLTINSMGLQIWIKYLQCLNPNQQVVYRGCHSQMMRYMVFVYGLLPMNSIFTSFYVPYECETCLYVEDILMIRGKDYVEASKGFPSRKHFPERINCSKCSSVMEISVLDSRYFDFLERQSK
jgi:hypothetical protein